MRVLSSFCKNFYMIKCIAEQLEYKQTREKDVTKKPFGQLEKRL